MKEKEINNLFKRVALFVVLGVLATLIAAFAYSDDTGCCLNPFMDSADFCVPRLSSICCPSPPSIYSGFYSSVDYPYGPEPTNCASSPYFLEGALCGSPEGYCDTGCCCNPEYDAGERDLPGDHVNRFFCDEVRGDFISAASNMDCVDECGDVGPPIDDEDCDSPSYNPQLTVDVVPDKGTKSFTLQIHDDCIANSYEITRCEKDSPGTCQSIGYTDTTTFNDDSDELMWNTNYEYMVQGNYAVQGIVSNNEKFGDNLGDLECWGREDNSYFCLHGGYYNKYEDYLIATNVQITPGNFISYVDSLYGSKFNKAYSCSIENVLSTPVGGSCSGDEVCVIENGNPTCKVQSPCEPDFDESPFGLFSPTDDYKARAEECYSLGYCYFDVSSTLVDKCYPCMWDEFMACYDYKSRFACLNNSCNIGNCQWKDIVSELGVGVCVDLDENNCGWCNKQGSEGLFNIIDTHYNSIFSSCNEEKASALSTAKYPCYYIDGAAKSCDQMSCPDLTSCPGSIILNNDNSISGSGQPCELNVCKDFSGVGCRKDANGDGERDCEEGDEDCELDHFAPNTTLQVISNDGVDESINILIEDMGADGLVYDFSGYKTYFCFADSSEDLCASKSGKDYILFTEEDEVIINGLFLYDSHSWSITTLSEGMNKIYFYTRDPYDNLGIVNTIEVEAHANNTKPALINVSVEEGTRMGNQWYFYTRNRRPFINLSFLKDVPVNLTLAELRDSPDSDIVVDLSNYTIESDASTSDYATWYKLISPAGTNLSEGTYKFFLNALNENNINLPLEQRVMTIEVNYSVPMAEITPPPPDVINTSLVTLTMDFPKKVTLSSVDISGVELVDYFPNESQKSFSVGLNLSDGTKIVSVSGKDDYNNDAAGYSEFVVNAVAAPILWMVSPTYGVSPTNTFNLTIESDNEVTCRYSMDAFFPDDSNFEFMAAFDATGTSVHHKEDMTINDENEHKIHVWCKDEYWRVAPYKYPFDLKVDKTKPVINKVNSLPASPIGEADFNITISAEINEPVICRYSTTEKNYSEMEGRFFDYFEGDFRTTKLKEIYIGEEGDYEFHIACEDMAGHISNTKTLSIEVDTSIPFKITDHTEEYQGNETPVLAIETNKKSACFYDFVDPEVTNGYNFGETDSYAHTDIISASVVSGEYEIYVKCFRATESAKQTVRFTVDLTPPVMEYVNDTSTFAGKPELSASSDRLFVVWYAVDNETGDRDLSYNISLLEAVTREPVINWTDNYASSRIDDNKFEGWIDEDHEGNDLNLSDDTKYIFKVKAGNIVGHWGTELESDGVTTDFSLYENSTCTNAVMDGDETDLNCGGSCPLCLDGKKCKKDYDCLSSYCNPDNICSDAECDDGFENGDETDVDCGGDDCDACPPDSSCEEDSDCTTGYCRYNICSDGDPCFNGVPDPPGETGTDCGGVCSAKCPKGEYCELDSDCESGLECKTGICKFVETEEVDTDGDGIPDSWEERYGLDPEDISDGDLDFDGSVPALYS